MQFSQMFAKCPDLSNYLENRDKLPPLLFFTLVCRFFLLGPVKLLFQPTYGLGKAGLFTQQLALIIF
jgi:hypothetical protein